MLWSVIVKQKKLDKFSLHFHAIFHAHIYTITKTAELATDFAGMNPDQMQPKKNLELKIILHVFNLLQLFHYVNHDQWGHDNVI